MEVRLLPLRFEHRRDADYADPMRDCGWGVSAIVFGAWEAVAYKTSVPTVSQTVWRLSGCRHRRLVQVAVVAYTAGLARHLLRPI